MRYICEKDHIFERIGKNINTIIMSDGANSTSKTTETPVCPICGTNIFSEYILDKKKITNIISVTIDEVGSKLQEGYEVESLYAKTATLVKRE